jgi:endonuclease/exonuclease/phosphatase family metal-dependent hydrolase
MSTTHATPTPRRQPVVRPGARASGAVTRRIHLIGFTAAALISLPACDRDPDDRVQKRLNVITANIYHDCSSLTCGGDNNVPDWPVRREILVNTIAALDPDVIGLQEAFMDQVEWLVNRLPGYTYYGRGREADGSGESVSILYRADTFERTDSGHFWLSDSKHIPGSKWSTFTGDPRITTWVRLERKDSRKGFYVFNNHWPPASEFVHFDAARLLASTIAEVRNPREFFLVLGDLNATSTTASYRYLRGENCPYTAAEDALRFERYCATWAASPPTFELVDSWRQFGLDGGTRCGSTASGTLDGNTGGRIDYVLVWKPGGAYPIVETVQRALVGGVCLSDHFAVYAALQLPLHTGAATNDVAAPGR